jgi:hypothetical protein
MNNYLLSIPILVPLCFLGAVGTSMIYDYIQIKYYNNPNDKSTNESMKKKEN